MGYRLFYLLKINTNKREEKFCDEECCESGKVCDQYSISVWNIFPQIAFPLAFDCADQGLLKWFSINILCISLVFMCMEGITLEEK